MYKKNFKKKLGQGGPGHKVAQPLAAASFSAMHSASESLLKS